MEKNNGGSFRRAGIVATLVLGFVFGLIIAWIYWGQRKQEREPSGSRPAEAERLWLEPRSGRPAAQPAAGVEPEPDDLTRVEGIGPKISSVLAAAGIVTFEELAQRDPRALKQLLRANRLQFADPATWPEQAALAAVGAWDALEELQGQLSGGRRVG